LCINLPVDAFVFEGKQNVRQRGGTAATGTSSPSGRCKTLVTLPMRAGRAHGKALRSRCSLRNSYPSSFPAIFSSVFQDFAPKWHFRPEKIPVAFSLSALRREKLGREGLKNAAELLSIS
jgi:hypothetical protein